jgi:hypothetical protein
MRVGLARIDVGRQPVSQRPGDAEPPQASKNAQDRLRIIRDLRDKGLIAEEEAAAKRKVILDAM